MHAQLLVSSCCIKQTTQDITILPFCLKTLMLKRHSPSHINLQAVGSSLLLPCFPPWLYEQHSIPIKTRGQNPNPPFPSTTQTQENKKKKKKPNPVPGQCPAPTRAAVSACSPGYLHWELRCATPSLATQELQGFLPLLPSHLEQTAGREASRSLPSSLPPLALAGLFSNSPLPFSHVGQALPEHPGEGSVGCSSPKHVENPSPSLGSGAPTPCTRLLPAFAFQPTSARFTLFICPPAPREQRKAERLCLLKNITQHFLCAPQCGFFQSFAFCFDCFQKPAPVMLTPR